MSKIILLHIEEQMRHKYTCCLVFAAGYLSVSQCNIQDVRKYCGLNSSNLGSNHLPQWLEILTSTSIFRLFIILYFIIISICNFVFTNFVNLLEKLLLWGWLRNNPLRTKSHQRSTVDPGITTRNRMYTS